MYKKFLSELEARRDDLQKKLAAVLDASKQLDVEKQMFSKRVREFEEEKNKSRNFYREKYKGFPTIAEAYEDFLRAQDAKEEKYFDFKIRSAETTAERVKAINAEKRKYVKLATILEKKLAVCIEYVPDLLDVLDQEFASDELEAEHLPYSGEEQEDPVHRYLTPEEYRSLSVTERNQIALDRYKQRRKDSKGIGTFYERFVGHLYETEGYDVTYQGVLKGREDRGIDLIARKGKDILIIQCKNWNKYKTIFENAIFQLFGSAEYYRQKNPSLNVTPVFYATTEIADFAKNFSQKVGIRIFDNHKIDYDYPMIKCNISRVNGEKIYHLPLDQQYDTVKVEVVRGEFYCRSVVEAEKKGFRRAYRWKGTSKK